MSEYNRRIAIYDFTKPTDGSHYMILEVLGMPVGKTVQVIKLSDKHSLKIVYISLPNNIIGPRKRVRC